MTDLFSEFKDVDTTEMIYKGATALGREIIDMVRDIGIPETEAVLTKLSHALASGQIELIPELRGQLKLVLEHQTQVARKDALKRAISMMNLVFGILMLAK